MTRYETDIAAWAAEQAQLVRARRFDRLDLEHIAEEIEDVGKGEQRELAARLALLMAHLLKWQCQPQRRGNSWRRTIKEQRRALAFHLKRVPSLATRLADPEWCDAIWADAVTLAIDETGLDGLPEQCPWTLGQVLAQDWLPATDADDPRG